MADSVSIHQLVLKPRSKASVQCRRLANASFQLTHTSHDDQAVGIKRAMMVRRKKKTTRVSLISRTFPPLAFDGLNYGNTNAEGRGLGDLVRW